MPRYKYRTIQNPAPGFSNITLEEAIESARIVAGIAAKGKVVTAKTKDRSIKKNATSKVSQNASSVSRAVSKGRKSASKSKGKSAA